MTKHKVIHIKNDCINCGACAAICPEYWEMDDEGFAHLKGSKEVGDHWELKIDTEEARVKNQEAAEACPVEVIKVEKLSD